MSASNEEDASTEALLVQALSQVLLSEAIEGLDDDLVAYMAGMLSSSHDESHDPSATIDTVLVPFLESVACPDSVIQQATNAVLQVLRGQQTPSSPSTSTRKLRQGIVSMSSELDSQPTADEMEANRYLWLGTENGVKAMANSLIDAEQDKSSAKDRRKARKELEKVRQQLASAQDQDIDTIGNSLVRMKVANYQSNDKSRDVLVRNITVSLDNGTLLLDASELKLAHARRYGLIGENGVGKTTLLKTIAEGNIEGFPQHLRVLHVRQEVPANLTVNMTVTQAVLQADSERMDLLRREQELVAKLEQPDDNIMSLQEKRQKLAGLALTADLKELDEIYARLQVLSSDSAEGRAAMILTGLQFSPDMQHAPLSSLSGGWKMRVALAAALFIEPDLCLLDEPTNHLDLEAVLWLESYLVTYKHTLVVVSHDRGFLNQVCTDIIQFKRQRLTYYRGNFDTYVKLRDENIRNAMRSYQAYQAKREHMMEFIDKFRANAKRATMVQSRIKAVEKMDAEAPEPVQVDPVWRFAIPNSEPLGPPIIAVNDVSFDFRPVQPDGTKKPESEFLLQQVNFGVDLTSKIAILGKNGQGKTTLLNLIMGRLKPVRGSVSINGVLRVGHFTQHSADNFDLKVSALENMLNMFEEAEDQEMRSFLGRFQIQGNDALKPMMLLSGGQKSRVAFAALAYRKPHVLVVDEGSNHLSMEAVDALVEAIQDFKGGMLIVSHDEHFVSNTCNELWVVDSGKVTRFRGDFEDYKKFTATETQKRVDESVKRINAVSTSK